MLRLPFFDKKNKLWFGLAGAIAFLVMYMLPNHLHFYKPHYIYMFDIEHIIPFIDWTIFIYMSDYIFVALVFYLLKDKQNMNRIFYSQLMLLFVAMIIFFIYPTAYPRPTVEYNGFIGSFVKFLHTLDTSSNACPSMHVAVTFVAAFGFIKEQQKKLFIFIPWAILISLSTLTVKQHYILDIVLGLAIAIIAYINGFKIKEKK